MDKKIIVLIVSLVLGIVGITAGIVYGETITQDQKVIRDGTALLERTAARNGYTSLGVIDLCKVHDIRAARRFAFERNGLEEPVCFTEGFVMDSEDIMIFRVIVYEDGYKTKKTATYLYGLY